MPGARLAPAASGAKNKSTPSKSTTVTPVSPGIPRAAGFNGLFQALPGDRAFLSPSPAQCASIVASLISASRYQDHMASPSARSCVRLVQISVHRIPHSTFVTTAKRPSCRRRDGGKNARDLPVVTSKFACDTMARRANHLVNPKSCQVAFSCPGRGAALLVVRRRSGTYAFQKEDGPRISSASP
jgi:hypothetical protein